MKVLIFFVLAALGAGAAVGWYSSQSAYVWPVERFGPYGSDSQLTPAGLSAHLQQFQPEGFPRVEVVGGADHDFGVMLRGAEGTHDFEIKNTGDAPLQLVVAGSTCKCTLGELADSTLEPGKSTKVHLSWTVKTTGSVFSQSANLRTNDPAAGELQLTIHGDVVDFLAAVPDSWDVGDHDSGEPIQLETTIYNRRDHDLQVQQAEWLDERIAELATVDIQPRKPDPQRDSEHADARQAFDVRVKIQPGLSQGTLLHTLRTVFVPEQEPVSRQTVDISLRGRIVGDIAVIGGSRLHGQEGGGYVYDMDQVEAGQGRTAALHVVFRGPHRNDARLKIASVAPADVLQAELGDPIPRASTVIYPLQLRIPEDAPPVDLTGKSKDDLAIVMIESDNPEVPPLRLGVKLWVRSPSQ